MLKTHLIVCKNMNQSHINNSCHHHRSSSPSEARSVCWSQCWERRTCKRCSARVDCCVFRHASTLCHSNHTCDTVLILTPPTQFLFCPSRNRVAIDHTCSHKGPAFGLWVSCLCAFDPILSASTMPCIRVWPAG